MRPLIRLYPARPADNNDNDNNDPRSDSTGHDDHRTCPWNVRPRRYICDMTITVELHPDTPFSLGAAAAFGFGPQTGRPRSAGDEMRLAFVTDDLRHHAGVHLAQRPDGTITAAIDSAADAGAVLGQVRRILSLVSCCTFPGQVFCGYFTPLPAYSGTRP